jgi:hypothetical protein
MPRTDLDIAALLAAAVGDDQRAFRLRVIEGIIARQQRASALRRLGEFVGVSGLVGATLGLLQLSASGIAIMEPLAVTVCLCAAAAELAGWLIQGRSLIVASIR